MQESYIISYWSYVTKKPKYLYVIILYKQNKFLSVAAFLNLFVISKRFKQFGNKFDFLYDPCMTIKKSYKSYMTFTSKKLEGWVTWDRQ